MSPASLCCRYSPVCSIWSLSLHSSSFSILLHLLLNHTILHNQVTFAQSNVGISFNSLEKFSHPLHLEAHPFFIRSWGTPLTHNPLPLPHHEYIVRQCTPAHITVVPSSTLRQLDLDAQFCFQSNYSHPHTYIFSEECSHVCFLSLFLSLSLLLILVSRVSSNCLILFQDIYSFFSHSFFHTHIEHSS